MSKSTVRHTPNESGVKHRNYVWYNDKSREFLESDEGYLLKGQTIYDRIQVICDTAEKILKRPGYSEKLQGYIARGFYSLSTPILTNFGTDRGLPISCFGSYIEDTMESILQTQAEVGMMTKMGGGTSAFFGNLRERGADVKNNGKSSGSVHFMQLFEKQVNVISQGSARRGSFCGYLPIDHPDILEFLGIRSEGHPIQHFNFGVCVPDDWMHAMIGGDKEKRIVWAKMLEARKNKSFPFIFFTDTVNNNTVDVYKSLGLNISHSNLCTEICLPDSFDESFVCDLASMNILHYDEWKDTDAVETLVLLLDAVMTEFIEKGKNVKFLERAVKFAKRHRALGIGWIGWHSYLQSKMIPYESLKAKAINVEVAKTIQSQAWAASKKMAEEYGEPGILEGWGRRHTTLTSIAPTQSSSWIFGQMSASAEPWLANIQIKDLAKGKYTIRNPFLVKLLEEKGKNTDPVWMDILKHTGSVQHLDFLSDLEKDVFKTYQEISPREALIQAAGRQRYIDQSQSLNLFIHPNTPTKDLNALFIEAWEMGIKTLYYQYSVNAAQEFSRELLACRSCEG